MADTNHAHHAHRTPPVEGDGISYSGIVWFVFILVATTIFCQLVVWGAFELMEWRVARAEPARAPLANEPINPGIEGGRVVTGTGMDPQPGLLVTEPVLLQELRAAEEAALRNSYGWVDRAGGTVRIPIDRAKDLLLERGLPVQPAASPAATASQAKPAAPGSAGQATGSGGQ